MCLYWTIFSAGSKKILCTHAHRRDKIYRICGSMIKLTSKAEHIKNMFNFLMDDFRYANELCCLIICLQKTTIKIESHHKNLHINLIEICTRCYVKQIVSKLQSLLSKYRKNTTIQLLLTWKTWACCRK